MKKVILFFCTALAILSIMAFGFIRWNDSETGCIASSGVQVIPFEKQVEEAINKKTFDDFIYDVGPRFGPIKKEDLDKAKSVTDLLSKDENKQIVSYKSVEIIIIENDQETSIRESGYNVELNEAQINLLQSSDYSTNFKIRAEYVKMDSETGKIEESYSTPHLTIVPEKQAIYVNGKDALMKFLRENSRESRANIQADQLQPAKLSFTVTKTGAIENVELDRTSNFPSIDQTMIDLIKNAPGKWEPAENSNGEKVDQVLVVSFGLIGC